METVLKNPKAAHALDIRCVIGNFNSYGMYNGADIMETVTKACFIGTNIGILRGYFCINLVKARDYFFSY